MCLFLWLLSAPWFPCTSNQGFLWCQGAVVYLPDSSLAFCVGLCGICLQEALVFPAKELRKHFRVGDHVKVVRGNHEGETGMVLRVEKNVAVLFSDLSMKEVRSVTDMCRLMTALHLKLANKVKKLLGK